MSARNYTSEELTLVANTIRMLSAEGVEKANSGHPGMPMGMADISAVLWLKHLRFNPRNPKWLARDRFVLSNGHGSMLLYSLLHLSGYKVSIEDLKKFRQWDSITPGHPESHMTEGVECTTGPLGQGISNAVGMALGQKMLAARYGKSRKDLFDHRVFCFVGDGCLMEGVSSEASSVAGHLGLGNLIVLYDDNHISIAGHTELAFTEDVLKRYEGYGWHVQRADGHNFSDIDAAINAAVAETSRPSIIAARTIIGKGSPNKSDSHDVHGSPLGATELAETRKRLGWTEEPFVVPAKAKAIFGDRIESLLEDYKKWEAEFASWKSAEPKLAEALDVQLQRSVPKDLDAKLLAAVPSPAKPVATRKLSQMVLQAASREVSSLIGGSADLEPSTLTLIDGETDIQKESFSGKNIRFGVREHGMGAILNGLSYYGGFIPYGSTFMCFADYMRPTLRLAALCHLQTLFIFTHDSIFLGEDGPTHQPVEHLCSLRIIPNLYVLRPADGVEVAMCYSFALTKNNAPSALVFTRQNLDPLVRGAEFAPADVKRGAYIVSDSAGKSGKPDLVIAASGSEVSLAVKVAALLEPKLCVRVVSIPCVELLKEQGAGYREQLFPVGSKRVVIEAGVTLGWQEIVGGNAENTLVVGLDHFGASAPADVLAEKFGFTPAAVEERIRERFVF